MNFFPASISRCLSTVLPALLLALSLTPGALARDIVVTPPPEGVDALVRLDQALAQAQPGDRVILREGEYRLSGPVTFPRAGEAGQPITLMAAPGEYVALLGSVRLTGWQRHEGDIWKIERPDVMAAGLFEDAVRLNHPRLASGKRENPPVSELRTPGTWTQDDQWVYLWTREGDTPDNHRIEAPQHWVMNVNQSWIRVEGLRMFFGQDRIVMIKADYSDVVGCEIAHASNSVDNVYAAYFSDCSNSAYRDCTIYDSYYWGDHGSNSHLVSTINCGDNGPNFVDRCTIFNGGLGVGTKGAAREVVVIGNEISDVVHGVSLTGERSAGPGAGKTDRGHYVIYGNRFSHSRNAIWAYGGINRNNRVWNNFFEHCDIGVKMRNYRAEPEDLQIVNNIFLNCSIGVEVNGGRKGEPTLDPFIEAGLASHHNLYWGNQVTWRNPLDWSRDLDLSVQELHERFPALGEGSIEARPRLDAFGRLTDNSPALGRGAELDLPAYIDRPEAWHIGLGPWGEDEPKPDRGLTLSIAGSAESVVTPGRPVTLKAMLTNESSESFAIGEARDVIVTYHFGYHGWHKDKQEFYRVRVELPAVALQPGASLDLSGLEGWQNPVAGELGDAFHLRSDEAYGEGCRLWATVRFVDRETETAETLQRLVPLIRSEQLLSVSSASPG